MEEALEDYYIYDAEFVSQLAIQNEEENDLTKVETHHIHCCQMVGEFLCEASLFGAFLGGNMNGNII